MIRLYFRSQDLENTEYKIHDLIQNQWVCSFGLLHATKKKLRNHHIDRQDKGLLVLAYHNALLLNKRRGRVFFAHIVYERDGVKTHHHVSDAIIDKVPRLSVLSR